MKSIVSAAITHRNLTAGWDFFFATSASKPMRGGHASMEGSGLVEIAARRDSELLAERGDEGARSRIAASGGHPLDRRAAGQAFDRLEQSPLPPPAARAHA